MLVAIVGAGACGLAAIKNCLEEGLDVIAFEKEGSGEISNLIEGVQGYYIPLSLGTHNIASVGGLWRYKESDTTVTTVMENTTTNFSKHRVRKIVPLEESTLFRC